MATALALSQPSLSEIPEDVWRDARWLPCRLRAEIGVQGFTMGDLMRIEVGSIVDSGMAIESDVNVTVNSTCVGCGRLDLVGENLAIRLTEIV